MDLIKKLHQKNSVLMVFLSALSVLITLGILAFIVFASHYGYDLTDESYYVLLIQHPKDYKYTVSQFGFFYHPIANLLNYNIPNLRIYNIVITYFLSIVNLGLLYFCVIKKNSFSYRKDFIELIAVAGIATASLLYFSTFNWLPTPSYNSLNFQGILLTVIGLFLTGYSSRPLSLIGWGVMSVGGWVVFMAKPSSAMLLAVICFLVLLLNKKISFIQILTVCFILVALFIFTIYSLDNGPSEFIKRYQTGLEGGKLLASGHDASSIWRLDFPNLSNTEWAWFSINSFLIALIVSYIRTRERSIVLASLFCIMTFAIYTGVICDPFKSYVLSLPYYSQLQVLSVPVGVGLSGAGYLAATRSIPKYNNIFCLSVIFMLIPYIYAFGTNNNYFHASTAVAFFWILAAVTMLAAIDTFWMRDSLLPLAFISQFITITFLFNAVQQPYRQPENLFKDTQSIDIGNSKIRVHKKIAKYLNDISALVNSSNFESEDSIIDFTGCSPGIAVILGTHNLGVPWLFGGYSGSNPMALFYLSKMPFDEIQKSWLITEPSGKLALNPDILSNWRLSLENDYELIGEVMAPDGYRGASTNSLQKIYKPKILK